MTIDTAVKPLIIPDVPTPALTLETLVEIIGPEILDRFQKALAGCLNNGEPVHLAHHYAYSVCGPERDEVFAKARAILALSAVPAPPADASAASPDHLAKAQRLLRDIAGWILTGKSETATAELERYWRDWRGYKGSPLSHAPGVPADLLRNIVDHFDGGPYDSASGSWLIRAYTLLTKAKVALSDAPGVPAGWKLVPVEPTDEMKEAALDSTASWLRIQGSQLTVNREKAAVRYRAMLSAAPPPPAVVQQEGWRPIETAPRDGTDFLALMSFQQKHHQMVGCFAPAGHFVSWPGRSRYSPSRWRPLPTPPVKTGGEGP